MDSSMEFLFVMMSITFVPLAGMLCGYFALPYKPVAFVLPVVALIGGLTGYALWDGSIGTIFVMAIPIMAPIGVAAGSAIRLGETGDSKTALKDAEHWAALASDAWFNGHLHLYVECAELAGDHYMKGGKPAKAVEQFQQGWDRQLERHDVHACMFTLGEKLIAALHACNKKSEAAAIQAAIESANERAEAIVTEELAGAAACGTA